MAPISPSILLALFPFPFLLFLPLHTLQHHPVMITSPPPLTPTVAAAVAPSPSPGSPLAPALFVIGDSTVDCGTNNYLATFARADHEPYGRDFDTHRPTGRFSNGRIIVDYLAARLGLPFIPPFWSNQTWKVEEMIHGVNYASAASGILFSSGSELGFNFPLSYQAQQVADTIEQFELNLGVEATSNLISKSIFYVSTGSNDFIHYYIANASGVRSIYLPWEFNQLLVNDMKNVLKSLYEINARRIVVMGLAPIGCTPHYLRLCESKHGECIDKINDVVTELNYAMRYMVNQLNHELQGALITFCDAFEGSMDILTNHEYYGFETVTEACCGIGNYKGGGWCALPEMSCSNASIHVWWDEFHPTAAVNHILADNVWSSEHTSMCYPINLHGMINW